MVLATRVGSPIMPKYSHSWRRATSLASLVPALSTVGTVPWWESLVPRGNTDRTQPRWCCKTRVTARAVNTSPGQVLVAVCPSDTHRRSVAQNVGHRGTRHFHAGRLCQEPHVGHLTIKTLAGTHTPHLCQEPLAGTLDLTTHHQTQGTVRRCLKHHT
eukprot:m.316305 g.316305  ORF g.316305 m.316305 type:complete len:158 (+) comp20284_c0_seq20:3887-4360(+)